MGGQGFGSGGNHGAVVHEIEGRGGVTAALNRKGGEIEEAWMTF